MRFLILTLLICVSCFAHAAEPAACVNLAAQACTGGPREDATGVATAVDGDLYAAAQLKNFRPQIVSEFKKTLKSPAGDHLKELILGATDAKNPVCIADFSSEQCTEFAASNLADLYTTAELSLDTPSYQPRFNAAKAHDLIWTSEYNNTATALTNLLSAKLPIGLVKKMNEVFFPNTQALLIETVNSLSIDDKVKKEMITKIKKVSFEGANCAIGGLDHRTGLLRALVPNANFDNDHSEVHVCSAYLLFTTSEFGLTALLAHELAHSIDPCNLAADWEKVPLKEMVDDKVVDNQYLKANFINCLRSKSSVGATSFRSLVPTSGTDSDFPPSDKGVFENSTARLCNSDQITESVADWFSAEVMARFAAKTHFSQTEVAAGISNIYRPICGDAVPGDVHPPTNDRLNSIFAVQPKIRKLMGCKSDFPGKQYCDINNPASLTRTDAPSLLQPKKAGTTR